MTEECGGRSKTCLISKKYLTTFSRNIAGLKSKVKERKLLDLLVTCLYFFEDVSYHMLLNYFTHLESVMNPLLFLRLMCQQLRPAEL